MEISMFLDLAMFYGTLGNFQVSRYNLLRFAISCGIQIFSRVDVNISEISRNL